MRNETFRLLVERVIPETDRVRTLRLRPARGEVPFRFLPGQHLGVTPLSGGAGEGPADPPETWRHFSLSSAPDERAFVEITVLRQGTASAALHRLSPGDTVEVTRPTGRFTLQDPADHGPVFLGAGIGVAPLLSMVRTCVDRNLGTAITVLLGFSSAGEAIGLSRFRAWAAATPRMVLRVHFSEPDPGGPGRPTPGGLADPDLLREAVALPRRRTCYLCLPAGLRDAVRAELLNLGVPADRVLAETW